MTLSYESRRAYARDPRGREELHQRHCSQLEALLAAPLDLNVDDASSETRRDADGLARQALHRLARDAHEMGMGIVPHGRVPELEAPGVIPEIGSIDEPGLRQGDEDAPDGDTIELGPDQLVGDLAVAHRRSGTTELGEDGEAALGDLQPCLTELLAEALLAARRACLRGGPRVRSRLRAPSRHGVPGKDDRECGPRGDGRGVRAG